MSDGLGEDHEAPKDTLITMQPPNKRKRDKIWQAALPQRERQALLSARKEKYAPVMEEDVKNYFKNLAQEE